MIDSKLAAEMPSANKDSILTAHTKLHLAKQLDKFLTSQKTVWANDLKTVSAQKSPQSTSSRTDQLTAGSDSE